MSSSDISMLNCSMFQTLYQGPETLEERGFAVGNTVHVGAEYSEKFGTVVALSPEFPHKAFVELRHKSGGASTCWIKSKDLLIHQKNDNGSRIDTQIVKLFGSLYQGPETLQERGFAVGDTVHVGADYSEKFGTIVALSPDFPHKACVEFRHKSGSTSTCWIKSEHLLIHSKNKSL